MESSDFASVFFGPGNDLDLANLVAGRWGEAGVALEPWLDRLRSRLPTMLPRRHERTLKWYGLAHSQAAIEDLRTAVQAWVGPSYSDFTGAPPPSATDIFELGVADFTGGHWFRLEVPPGMKNDVRVLLDRMRRQLEARPNRTSDLAYPIGRLLRDFEWAVLAGDPERSLDLLRAIQATGQVSAMNVSYLKVRRFAALGLGHDLLALPELPDVIATRRPTAVTSAILDALHGEHIEELASARDVDGAQERFEERIAGRYNGLFSGVGPSPRLGELRLHMLWAAMEPPKPELCGEVMEAAAAIGIDDAFLADLAGHFSSRHPAATPFERIALAITNGAYKAALDQLKSIEDGRQHAELAIRAACELGDPDSASFALFVLDGLSADDRSGLRGSRIIARAIAELEATVSEPDGWLDLLARIGNGTIDVRNITRVRDRWDSWEVGELLDQLDAAEAVLLGTRTAQTDALLRSVIPALVSNLLKAPDAIEDPRVQVMVHAVLAVLQYSDGRSPGDLETLLDLADRLLAVASTKEYRQLISDLLAVWGEEISWRRLPWLIDLAEIIAAHPRRDPGSVATIAAALHDGIGRWGRRLAPLELAVVIDVLGDLGSPAAELTLPTVPVHEAEVEARSVPPALIGIYTLTPGVGERVARILEEQVPSLDVRVNADTHATSKLVSLSREADVLVVVTRSATHAATDAIHRNRPKGRPILYAGGKGSTSVLAALANHFGFGQLAA